MDSSKTFIEVAGMAALGASAEEMNQFAVLWQEHLRLLNQGKLVYYLPRAMGTRLSNMGALEKVAKNMRWVSVIPFS
jgi:hypothetical protein